MYSAWTLDESVNEFLKKIREENYSGYLIQIYNKEWQYKITPFRNYSPFF